MTSRSIVVTLPTMHNKIQMTLPTGSKVRINRLPSGPIGKVVGHHDPHSDGHQEGLPHLVYHTVEYADPLSGVKCRMGFLLHEIEEIDDDTSRPE